MYRLELSQSQEITFVMIDAAGNEVAGLGNTFILELRKPGGAFVGSAGVKAEIGNGWYSYVTTAAETDTVGPLSVRVTGAGCVQQNLEYVVETRAISAIEFTYTVTDSVTLLPIEGVQVWIATDLAGARYITYQAAWKVGEGLPAAWEVATAKAWVSDACQRIGADAHQVHGGIGFTYDYDLHYYYKRFKVAEVTYGDADFYRERVAQALGV